MNWSWLDDRPQVVAIVGPNGAGKTTFYHSHVAPSGLRLVNADRLALEFAVSSYDGARLADSLRRELVSQQESFAFETVFSDPVGDKLSFLQGCCDAGYSVALLFVGLSSPALSRERVAMRVSQGGHDVPLEKIKGRFPRTLANLKQAIRVLPRVVVFDNSDLLTPYRRVAMFEDGVLIESAARIPRWFRETLRMR